MSIPWKMFEAATTKNFIAASISGENVARVRFPAPTAGGRWFDSPLRSEANETT